MLHQIGQVTDQALVGILCAVVYQNLMIAFQRGQHIHTKRNQFNCRCAVQCGRIHGSICHSCELFDLWNCDQPNLLLLGLGKGLFFVILCLRKCFRIYPCDFIVPVIDKADDICLFCASCFQSTQRSTHHLRHQCCGNGGACQKYCMGFWQVCSLCEDIDVDEYLDFSIAVCFDFTFVVCIGNGDARYHILYFGNDKLWFDTVFFSLFVEKCI